MKRNIYLLLLITIGLCVGKIAQATVIPDQLLGTWYAQKKEEDGETMKWLVRRMDTENYVAITMICDGKNTSWVQEQIGTWQLKDDSLVNTVKMIEDVSGKKAVNPNQQITYTEVKRNNDTLSYKKGAKYLLSFNKVDSHHKISCGPVAKQ